MFRLALAAVVGLSAAVLEGCCSIEGCVRSCVLCYDTVDEGQVSIQPGSRLPLPAAGRPAAMAF